jgi:hypothetical protein
VDTYVRKNAATCVREIAKHTPEVSRAAPPCPTLPHPAPPCPALPCHRVAMFWSPSRSRCTGSLCCLRASRVSVSLCAPRRGSTVRRLCCGVCSLPS